MHVKLINLSALKFTSVNMVVLKIAAHHLAAIVKAAGKRDIEVCGFLFGHGGEVEEIAFVTNRLNSRSAFEMEPVEMVKVLEEAERNGLEVVGIFHSHVGCPPEPSERDLRGMERWPVVWLIVGKGEYRAWRLGDGGLEEVTVVVK